MPEFSGPKRRFLVRCPRGKTADAVNRPPVNELCHVAGVQAPNQSVKVTFTDDEKRKRASRQWRVKTASSKPWPGQAVKLADEEGEGFASCSANRRPKSEAAPQQMQVPGVAEENRKLEEAAREMDSSGNIAKARRKAMQFENYADKYQKGR